MKAEGEPVSSPSFAGSVNVYLPGPRRPSSPLVPGSNDGRHCTPLVDNLFTGLCITLPDATYIDIAGDAARAAAFLSSLE